MSVSMSLRALARMLVGIAKEKASSLGNFTLPQVGIAYSQPTVTPAVRVAVLVPKFRNEILPA